jgi:hypothetical protein
MSAELELEVDNHNYCFAAGAEYHLWHTEDMRDTSQDDNQGVAKTDIYTYISCN